MISAITGAPIIPMIMEYIETNDILQKEINIYKNLIVHFSKNVIHTKPVHTDKDINVIRDDLIRLRKKIWKHYNIKKDSLEDVEPKIYINHTYLKKFKGFGFVYDSASEAKFLRGNQENKYTLNDKGILVPGITEKKIKF